MRILILNIQYYPVVNPNVYRWSAIAEYWSTSGHEVHILCSKAGGEPRFEKIKGVSVHRVGHSTLLDFIYNTFRIKNRRGLTQKADAGPTSGTRRFLEKLMDGTWRKIYWPDGSCIWYFPARKKANKLQRENQFDALITVGLPFTSHLIGKHLKSVFPKLRWHMDIEDPFSYSKEFFVNNFNLYGHLNLRVEKSAFEKADSISVTVDTAGERYQDLFRESAGKISVIPPLANLPKMESKEAVFDKEHIHLCYFGTFYLKVRSPEPLLLIIRQLMAFNSHFSQKLQFHVFGEINPFAREVFNDFGTIGESIIFHGLVDRHEVALAMQQADFLINIGNTTNYHLPSKSVDYLMSGKPILNIVQNERDTFQKLLKNYPFLLNVSTSEIKNGETQLMEEIVRFIKANRGKRAKKEIINRLGSPFTLEKIAQKYLDLLQ